MYNNASDDDGNLIFEYPNVDEPTLLKYLKEGAKSSLSDHPERIVGKKGYKKSDGACEVHQVKR
jgi:hypothetical protein